MRDIGSLGHLCDSSSTPGIENSLPAGIRSLCLSSARRAHMIWMDDGGKGPDHVRGVRGLFLGFSLPRFLISLPPQPFNQMRIL